MDKGMRVRQAVVIALEKASSPTLVENWYYLDEVLTLHQLGKDQTFEDAYAEMEIAATNRGHPALTLIRVARFLNVSIEWLILGEEKNSGHN